MKLEENWKMKRIKMLGGPSVSITDMNSPYTAQSRTDPNCIVGVYERSGEKVRLGEYHRELDEVLNLDFEK